MKRFIIGFWIMLFIIILFYFSVAIKGTAFDVLNFLLQPVVMYVFIAFAGKITASIYSEILFYITKYIGALFFIICTLAIAEWDDITTFMPLFVSISILCNWNIKDKNASKKREEENPKTESNKVLPYLINFITLIFIYVITSMYYYSLEKGEGVWFDIIIMGIAFCAIFWLGYLSYRYLIKVTETTKLFKIILVLGLLYGMYYFCSSIKEIHFHLLISGVIATFISLTVQNLILTNKILIKGNK